jgi:glycosyltransferase involved in cell wall biosynthesis
MWSGEAQKKLITALEKIGPIDAVCMLSLTEKLLLTEELVARDVRVFWIEHDRVGRWLRQNPQLGRLQELSRRVMTVAVSELSRGLYRDLGWVPERTVAIPNGIDPNRFEIKPVADHQTNELHVGCIARLSPEKGIDLLIDAVAPLAHVRLSIVGKGKDEAKLRHQIERLALGDRVQIKPPVSDLGAFYQSLDVFVLPSRDNDPFGLVAAEAMMIGLPVIVTKQTGVASYLEHGVDALVVEPTSLDISKAIDLLSVLHTRQQIAQNARTTALARFTVSRMVDDYEKLMQSCIES